MILKSILVNLAISAFLFFGMGLFLFKFINEDEYDPELASRASIFAWASRCEVSEIENWTCGKPC